MKKAFLVMAMAAIFGACNSNNNKGGIHHDSVPDRSDYPGTDRSNTQPHHTDTPGTVKDTVKTGFGK